MKDQKSNNSKMVKINNNQIIQVQLGDAQHHLIQNQSEYKHMNYTQNNQKQKNNHFPNQYANHHYVQQNIQNNQFNNLYGFQQYNHHNYYQPFGNPQNNFNNNFQGYQGYGYGHYGHHRGHHKHRGNHQHRGNHHRHRGHHGHGNNYEHGFHHHDHRGYKNYNYQQKFNYQEKEGHLVQNSNNNNNNQYQKQQINNHRKWQGCKWNNHKNKWHSRDKSLSQQSSSSSRSKSNTKSKYSQKNELKEKYNKMMIGYFEVKNINNLQREQIIKILINRYPNGNVPFQILFKSLDQLQKDQLIKYMKYKKLIKVLIKFDYNMEYARPKLAKIQQKRYKKFKADKQFNQKWGDLQLPQILDLDTLINDKKQYIFIVDGNNIMPTIKHFRNYFIENNKNTKVKTQIKLTWFLANIFKNNNCILFFDQKYDNQIKNIIIQTLIKDYQQRQLINNFKVIYGQITSADNKIVQYIQTSVKANQNKYFLLVSADRQLNVRCFLEDKTINFTGGKFFFKYAKYMSKIMYKQNKQNKRLIKHIIQC